jgi:hypothetical protein
VRGDWSAVGPPHFPVMSIGVSRVPPGTVQRTRFSQFRAAFVKLAKKQGGK